MKRNFTKLIEAGAALAEKTGADLYTDEMRQIREQATGKVDTMARAYYAGLAAGYRLRKTEERRKAASAEKSAAKKAEKDRRALLLEVGTKLGYRPDEIKTALEYAAPEGGQA